MGVAGLVVIADQVTKYAVIQYIELYGRIPLNEFLTLTHQRNTGVAFSLFADMNARWFLVALALLVSAYITWWLWSIRKEGPMVVAAGLSLVLGGAVGNMIDRALLGYVTDFIQVRFAGVPFFDPFPSFNVADAAISVGVVLLIIDALFLSGGAGPEINRSGSGKQTRK